jgi:hypothetical protein
VIYTIGGRGKRGQSRRRGISIEDRRENEMYMSTPPLPLSPPRLVSRCAAAADVIAVIRLEHQTINGFNIHISI